MKDYHTRKRRDHSKNKEYVRLYYILWRIVHTIVIMRTMRRRKQERKEIKEEGEEDVLQEEEKGWILCCHM
jgi:hypothetical protein